MKKGVVISLLLIGLNEAEDFDKSVRQPYLVLPMVTGSAVCRQGSGQVNTQLSQRSKFSR